MISNWVNSKKHHTVISKHNEVLEQMSKADKEEERKNAEKYNESLSESAIPIEDPFADNASSDNVMDSSYFNVLNIGETMGSIEIPSINVNLPIYHGISDDVLQEGIGHMSNSSFPVGGLGSHTALTGHRGLPSSKLFRDLDKVKNDDVFLIHTLDDTLAYKIDDIQIVLPNETSWLNIVPDKDYVTLITCEPYMINTHRLLVRGERIPYVEEIAFQHVERQNDRSILKWILAGTLILFITIIIVYNRKKALVEG